MAVALDVYPLTLEEIVRRREEIDNKIAQMAVEARVVDTPTKLLLRDARPRDFYDMSGTSGVTVLLSNGRVWTWSITGATAGTEKTIVEIPSSAMSDWNRVSYFWYFAFYDPSLIEYISEIRFYKENVMALSFPVDVLDELPTETILLGFKPSISYRKTDTQLKITVMPEATSATFDLKFGGRTALPVGKSGEPNPGVLVKGRV